MRAVDGVSLDVRQGEILGLVGESGCGKTTLGRTMLRLYEPTAGSIEFDGVDITTLKGSELRFLRRRMQMVFQDPYASLNPRRNVASLIGEPLKVHTSLSGEGRRHRTQELLQLVGLPPGAINRYPHQFSGGQRQRIGVARALAISPDLIVADEPVSALDVSIQAQLLNLFADLQTRLHLSIVFVAHDLAVVRHISDRIAVMYLGVVVETGPSDALSSEPLHPYTKCLISAIPVPDPTVQRGRERIVLYGDLPSPTEIPRGCRFNTRCPWRQPERCDSETPLLRSVGNDRTVACHYVEDIVAGRIKARFDRVD